MRIKYVVRMCRIPMAPAVLSLAKPTPPPSFRVAFSGAATRCRLSGLVAGGMYILQLSAVGVESRRESECPEVTLVRDVGFGSAFCFA